MSEREIIEVGNHEAVTLRLPDGSEVGLWVHHCDSCTSIDLWRTRGREDEEISAQTGATDRAPMGLFGFKNGHKVKVDGDRETYPESHGHSAVSTIVAVWNKSELDTTGNAELG